MKIDNPKLLWQLTFEGDWPSAIAFLGSGRKLAAANQDGHLYIWDLPEQPPEKFEVEKNSDRKAPDHPPTRRLEGHTNSITRLRATPDGKLLISASYDHTVRLWNPEAPATGEADAILNINARRSKAKREKKDDILTAPGVKVETISATQVLEGHSDWVMALGISADGKRLISGDGKSNVIVWDLPSAKEVKRWTGLPWNWIAATALSPNGQLAVVSEYSYKRDDFDVPAAALKIWDASNGEVKIDIVKQHIPKYDISKTSYDAAQAWRKFFSHGLICVDISPDGKLLAAGQGGENETGKIHIIEMETGKVLREISGHRYGVTDCKFSADSRLVLSTGRDTTLRITQVADGKEVAALGSSRGGQFKDWLSAVAISPDEKFVAATDISGMIQVWSLTSS
jgi:WD40 repeat protein